jgi:hypothetical protein
MAAGPGEDFPVSGAPTSPPGGVEPVEGRTYPPRWPTLEPVVRRVAAVSAAAALLGLLVGGVGGRLGMAFLAAQNPDATGKISDDGFRMGQFTVGGTIQLFGTSVQIGLIAGLIYLVLRPLTIGPRWLRITELATGAAVSVAAFLIHPNGVDFAVLDPALLAVALFVAIPAVFVTLLCLFAERWLTPDSWFTTAPLRQVASVLLVWLLSGPLVVLAPIAVGIGVAWRMRDMSETSKRAASVQLWVARVAVGLVGIGGLMGLLSDIAAVT